MSEPTRYPLCWPAGKARTARPAKSAFDTTLGRARDELLNELKILGASQVVLSSNLRLRKDDLPYADQREPDDPGVAVYFRYQNRPRCFAVDRWDKVRDNLRAVCLTINALRGIARWGTGDMVEAAFTGFAMLPPAGAAQQKRPWWDVFDVNPGTATVEEVTAEYRRLVKFYHPDRNPGDASAEAKYAQVDAAYTEFKKERGL